MRPTMAASHTIQALDELSQSTSHGLIPFWYPQKLHLAASNKRTPSPNRKTSCSAKPMQQVPPSNVDVPTPSSVSTSVHRSKIESKGPSSSSMLPPFEEQMLSATANEQPSLQGALNNTSNVLSNAPGIAINGASQPPKEEENRRFFGIPGYQGHSYVDRSYDYMRKYPPDAPGKELGPDARVWKVYLDESESYDNDMIRSFRDTIDSLLVFAALFSSVVTGFLGQTSQALEPDYAKIGVSLLFEQIQVLRAAGNANRIEEIPRSPLTPDSITHSSLDVAINWLFFASLAFSLATAFIAVLIKQWLQAFTALIPGDAKVRSLTRQFRFTGLQKWKLPEIINVLPLFLHLALALFLIGLCCFVSHFHPSITVMVSTVTCAAVAFYIITGSLPAVHLDCPYRLAVLFIPACLMVYAFKMIHFKIRKQLYKSSYLHQPSLSLSPLSSQEQYQVSRFRMNQKLECLSLAWLFNQTPNASVQRVAVHGVSRLLQLTAFEYLERENLPSFKGVAISLRDSLPLRSMSNAAVHFFTADSQLEDGPLLRDLILSSRQVCGYPLLPVEEMRAVLNSPYARALVEHDVFNVDPKQDIRPTIFSRAIQKDKWDVVMSLLDSSLDTVWDFLDNGCQALAFATVSEAISHEDWITIFSITKQKEIDFNAFHYPTESQSTPLHLVSSYGTVAALQHLISHVPNLDLNVADSYGSTPLHFACERGKDYPKHERPNFETPFWIFGYFMDNRGINLKKPVPLIARTLLSAQADPNIVDNAGCLPLHNACSNAFQNFGCTEEGLKVVDQLLTATTDINQRSKDGLTPLDLLEKSDRRDTEEGKAGYSLMRKHGARLARELTEVDEDEDKEETPSLPP